MIDVKRSQEINISFEIDSNKLIFAATGVELGMGKR
jgi:hypothetical protein